MLTIGLLGGMRLELDGADVAPPESRRARTLLTWLALHPGSHGRSKLAGQLRPDAGSEEDARRHLRQAIWLVGRALGEQGGDLLVATRTDLGLNPARVTVDVNELREQASAGDLEAARTLRTRPLLPEHDEDWAVAARDELRAELSELLARHAADAEAGSDLAGAVRWARERATADPLSEVAQTELMRLLTASGDRAAAIQVADALRRRLSDELGVTPSAETRAAIEAVLSDDRPSRPRSAPRPRPTGLPAPLATLTAEPFAGREAVVTRVMGMAGAGPAQFALVSGEAGIGKTRLAAEVAARVAAGGGAVLFGRCDEEALASYQPFAEALERAVGDGTLPVGELPQVYVGELARMLPGLAETAGTPASAPDPDPDLARYRMFEAVRGALACVAADRPTLLVLDDVQWADTGGLALLTHLAARLRDEQMLVLMTYRDAEPGVGRPHALPRLITQLRRSCHVERIALDPLDRGAIASLAGADAEPGLAAEIHRRTGGNSLFVVETLRSIDAGDEAMPAAVRDLIDHRLTRLGDDALAVVRAAAVAGLEFDLRDLRAVCDLGEEALLDGIDRALHARLIREKIEPPGAFQFAHALVADAVYAGMSGARRARLHARLGEALAARGAAPAAVAHHLLAAAPAGDRALTLVWAERAATAALAALAYADAAAFARRALLMADDAPTRARLLTLLGDAVDRDSLRGQAREAFAQAADAAREAGDAATLARAALGYKGLAVTVTVPDRATVDLLMEALAGLGEDDPVLRARVLAALALEGYYADPAEARALAGEAVLIARRVDDPGTLAHTLSARHLALWDGEHVHERLAVADEMAEVARAAGDPVAVLQARNWRVIDLLDLGRIDDTEAEAEAYEREAEDLRLPRFAWYVPLWRACIAMLRGEWERAERFSLDAAERGSAAGDPNAAPYRAIQRTQWLAWQERWSEIDMENMERATADSPTGRGAWIGWLAVIYFHQGDHDRAQALHDELAADDFAALPFDANWHSTCDAALSVGVLGTPAQARSLLPRMAPFERLNPTAGRGSACYGPAAYYMGGLAAMSGREEEAARLYGVALEEAGRMGARPIADSSRARLAELGAAAARPR